MKRVLLATTLLSSLFIPFTTALAQEGATIDVAITAQPPTLDPATTVTNAALDIAIHMYETLYTMDENYSPQPMLAESYEVNEDYTEYTFTIRQGKVFHNGEEMTVDDVVASMNYWLSKSERAQNLLGEGQFEKIDETTLKISFDKTSKDLVSLMASRANFPAIHPATVIEGATDTGVTEHIGTGPFKFEEWVQDQHVLISAFEDYQQIEGETSAYAGNHEALVDYVKFHIVPDASTRVAGALSETYDVVTSTPNDSYDQLANTPYLNMVTGPGGTLVATLDVNEGPLADQAVREALLTGLNMDELGLAAYGNPELFSINPSYMNPESAQWDVPVENEAFNANNVELAQEKLAETGYNNELIVLVTTPDYNEMYNATIALQAQMMQIGFNVEVESYDFATFMERKNDFENWDVFITSNGYQVNPHQTLSLNPDWGGADDERWLAQIEELSMSLDDEESKVIWEDLQNYMYNDYINSFVIAHYNSYITVNEDVEGVTYWQTPFFWNATISE